MKKIRNIKKYHRYQLQCAKRELNKKTKVVGKKPQTEFNHIMCSNNFSIINNSNETLKTFETIISALKKRKKVFVNLSRVDNLTLETILYLNALWFYDDYSLLPKNSNNIIKPIKKLLPKDKMLCKLIVNSGLFKNKPPEGSIFNIRRGFNTETSIIKEAIEFSLDQFDQKTSHQYKKIYESIVEMMANTVEHAFMKNVKKATKWHLMCWHEKEKGVIRFAFLDTGVSIPVSIFKKWYEKIGRNLISGDAKLIKSALDGTIQRTQTKKKYRGKGLPAIYKNSKNYFSNLKIISNRGYIDCENQKEYDLSIKFRGTLYCWDVFKMHKGGNK